MNWNSSVSDEDDLSDREFDHNIATLEKSYKFAIKLDTEDSYKELRNKMVDSGVPENTVDNYILQWNEKKGNCKFKKNHTKSHCICTICI